MKTIFFLTILLSALFALSCPLFAEDISESYERDKEVLQADELPPSAPRIIPQAREILTQPAPQKMETMEAPKKPDAKQKAMSRDAAKQAKKQAKLDEKARKESEKEAEKRAKEEDRIKMQEDAMAKKAERAKSEEELERKRLIDAQRREKLYDKIGEIEKERNVEYRQKKDRDKAPALLEQRPFETIPEDVAGLIKKGDECYSDKDYDKAREHYDKARFLAEEKKKKK